MDGLKEDGHLLRVKAFIFDFDGTLAVLNIDFTYMRDKVLDLVSHFGVEEGSIKERYLLEIIDEVYPILWRRKPSDADEFYEKAHQVLHGIEMKAAEEGMLIPGVQGTLEILRKKGMKIGIVTRNCEDAVRKVFPRVDDFCDVFIPRDSIKKVKPHPDHLTAVIRALKVSGEETVMVGDHPLDVQAGRRVGMRTIGVLTGRTKREEFEKAEADYVLNVVSDIARLLKEGGD